jgi:hypothetical protein
MGGQRRDLHQQTDEQSSSSSSSSEERMLDEETIQDLEVTEEAGAAIKGGFGMTVTRHGAWTH